MTSVAQCTERDQYASSDSNPFGVAPLGDELVAIESECGFWTSSPELQYLCATAHRRGVGRWALLGAVLGNLLSWLPPYVVMCDRDGSTSSPQSAGSLNFFVHMVSESGEGKTRLMGVAEEVVPPNVNRYGMPALCTEPEPDKLTSGTGEGLCKHFVALGRDPAAAADERNAAKVMVQRTDVAVVQVDEVSTYIGELERTTSKAAGVLTSLWSGQATGSNTGGEDSRTKIPKHAVRLIVTMLGQPSLCTALFTDKLVEGGTPQRPLWLPGDDWTPCPVTAFPNTPGFHRPTYPYPTTVHHLLPTMALQGVAPTQNLASFPVPVGGAQQQAINTLAPELNFPRAAASPEHVVWIRHSPQMAADIAAEDTVRQQNKLSPAQKVSLSTEEREARKGSRIRTHTMFTRIKVAVALGLLHRRPDFQPTDQDWELAGVIMRVSLGMLAYLYEEGVVARRDQNRVKGKERAEEHDAFSDALDEKETDQIGKLLRNLIGKVSARPMTYTALSRSLSSKRQKMLRSSLDRGVDNGLLFLEEGSNMYFPVVGGIVHDPRKADGIYVPGA